MEQEEEEQEQKAMTCHLRTDWMRSRDRRSATYRTPGPVLTYAPVRCGVERATELLLVARNNGGGTRISGRTA